MFEYGFCLRILEGHCEGLESACVSSDGLKIISRSGYKSVRVWDMFNVAGLSLLVAHTGEF